MTFDLHSPFQPAGDQPLAIERLISGSRVSDRQTLLGVTGSGKTFTIANVIANLGAPVLVLSHNKSLAAQLFEEFKGFFPNNHVEFFISYYDYYQPESYIAQTDTYIEKDAQINEKIEQMRMRAIESLLKHRDVIIVSSVSCIYGLGDPRSFESYAFEVTVGETIARATLIRRLIEIQYERDDVDLRYGSFRVRGDTIDIFSAGGRHVVRIDFSEDVVDSITIRESVTLKLIEKVGSYFIFPATPYVYSGVSKADAINAIRAEMELQLTKLNPLEAYRLKQRTLYDLEMIEQLGYCKGIENYSRHFEGRQVGEPPSTLLDYFPKDYLTIIDESHVTLPQVSGMYKGDRSRKTSLIDNGFRLQSAYDNRPLQFHEFEKRLGRVIYVSATPSDYELGLCGENLVEQLIRPTGLVDPPIEIRPTAGQIENLIAEISLVARRDHRILVTTLTRRMAEELNAYFLDHGIRSHYLHSEIDTLERIAIIRDLRLGKFDVLIGINLLREGIDLPEVALVAILDADKEGFLRTERSLIQTIGRAARNSDSKVIMYADKITASMDVAIKETNRRRFIQIAHNKKHGITPTTISKKIGEVDRSVQKDSRDLTKRSRYSLCEELIRVQTRMQEAANRLDFEEAILLREEVKRLEALL